MRRYVGLSVAFVVVVGCSSSGKSDGSDDGGGGDSGVGGAALDGLPVNPVFTAMKRGVDQCHADRQAGVFGCAISTAAVSVGVGYEYRSVNARFQGWEIGRHATEYEGPDWGDSASRDSVEFCGASSDHTMEPCTIELKELTRGTASTKPDVDPIEVGSRVHISVKCPEVMNEPNESDSGGSQLTISPNEFELIAEDCRTVGL